nr:MAG TPA: Major capsid protein [Microviridae sp.]
MLTRAIGKNTLGDNNKMKVHLRTYNRSTHNLSYIWRNTQAVGTLVPFMSLPMTKDDTFEIHLQSNVLTHPTIGPLFGSFKLQNDVFFCPIRLYNSWLHNNKTKIGLKMSAIKLPQWVFEVNPGRSNEPNDTINMTHPSSLWNYLGLRGTGQITGAVATKEREFNAVPALGYYDIFKNYYANKQENNFYFVDYFNRAIKVIVYTGTSSGGSEVWRSNNPNRLVGAKLLKANRIEIQLNKDFIMDQNEFEANTTISIRENTSTPGLTKYSINKYPIAQILQFVSYIPTTNTYTYKIKPSINQDPLDIYQIQTLKGKLQAQALTDIDEIRELILGTQGNTPFRIAANNTTVKMLDYLCKPNDAAQSQSDAFYYTPEWGLVVKTYQSDICQNWINTEWIDGDDGINKITAVAVEDGKFTIDALNLANKVYNYLNRIAVSDGSYRAWLETTYTGGYTERTETPIYCGGQSAEIVFQEVVSTAASTDEPLGTLAGRGMDTNKKGGKIIVRATEPGYLIGISSITPRLDYTQGNQFDVNLKTIDDLHKPALDGIGFQDLSAELLHANTTTIDGTSDTITQKFIGKQPAWIDYMTNINKAFGNFVTNENFMILSRQYELKNSTIKDMTTYIDPTLYNGIFADQSFDAQNFWVQIGVNIKARRLMSAKIIPNL